MLVTNIWWVTARETAPLTGTKAGRTRARLVAAAYELFGEQGYDATTVAQIARRAGVTEMTFYRHVGSKERLIVEDPYDPLIAAAIGREPVDLPPLVRAVRGVRSAWEGRPLLVDDETRARIAIGADTASLQPAIRSNTAATEAAIAAELVAGGTDPGDAAVCASAVLGALMTALFAWAGRAKTDPTTDLGAALVRALDLLEGHA